MSQSGVAEYVAEFRADTGVDRTPENKPVRRGIPWMRIAVDALIVAAMLLASSNFLTVR